MFSILCYMEQFVLSICTYGCTQKFRSQPIQLSQSAISPKKHLPNVFLPFENYQKELFDFFISILKRKPLWLFFTDRVHMPKGTKPLWGSSLPLTTKSPGIPGTHFMDLRRIRDWVDYGAAGSSISLKSHQFTHILHTTTFRMLLFLLYA